MAYVLLCNVKPSVPAGKLHSVVSQAVKVMLENGGIVREVRNNGLRRTAYSFKGKGEPERAKESHMFTVEFFSKPEALEPLNRTLRMDERILRFTTLRAPETLPRVPRHMRV